MINDSKALEILAIPQAQEVQEEWKSEEHQLSKAGNLVLVVHTTRQQQQPIQNIKSN